MPDSYYFVLFFISLLPSKSHLTRRRTMDILILSLIILAFALIFFTCLAVGSCVLEEFM